MLNLAAQIILNIKKSRQPKKRLRKKRIKNKNKNRVIIKNLKDEDKNKEDINLPEIISLIIDLASDEEVSD